MISTKAFADLCSTTKKTIIYYDRIGILKPHAKIGQIRQYHPRQVLSYQKIVLLKTFGLSLKEIKKNLRSPALIKIFIKQQEKLIINKLILEKRIAKLKEFNNNLKQGKPLVVPVIKAINPYQIYGIEKVGRYVDIASHQTEIFKLIGDPQFYHVGLTIFYGPSFSPHQSKMITGFLIKSHHPKLIKGVSLIAAPAHKAVSYTHIGSYNYMSYIWQFLDKYITENRLKRHPKLFCREFYLRGGLVEKNEDNLITELQIPIID